MQTSQPQSEPPGGGAQTDRWTDAGRLLQKRVWTDSGDRKTESQASSRKGIRQTWGQVTEGRSLCLGGGPCAVELPRCPHGL